jgi:hypothetical protein
MIIKLSLSFLALNYIILAFSSSALAANCYGSQITGFVAVEDYQRAANQICMYTPSVWFGIGNTTAPSTGSYYYVAIAGNFSGTDKGYCWVSRDSVDIRVA